MTAAARKIKVFGVIAEFESAAELYRAAEQVRDRGYCFWDVHSPFPIHGMDEAMGLEKSPLGYIIFWGGFVGFLTAALLQFIPSSFLYPLIVHGKPVKLFYRPGLLPDHVRADDSILSIYGVLWCFRYEPASEVASSVV